MKTTGTSQNGGSGSPNVRRERTALGIRLAIGWRCQAGTRQPSLAFRTRKKNIPNRLSVLGRFIADTSRAICSSRLSFPFSSESELLSSCPAAVESSGQISDASLIGSAMACFQWKGVIEPLCALTDSNTSYSSPTAPFSFPLTPGGQEHQYHRNTP